MRSVLSLLCLLLLRTRGAGAMDPSLPFKEYLDQDQKVCLMWGFDDMKGNITFKLVVNTTGWVGFGLSPNGNMVGADIVMGAVGSDGKTYFTDRHGLGKFMPIVDHHQDYGLLSLSESDGQTAMMFTRKIDTCDHPDDIPITDQPMKLIYAYGEDNQDEPEYHQGRRGTKTVNLLNYRTRATINSLNYIDATMDNVTVPPHQTYYHCKVIKFPSFDTKHHIYQFEPVIENIDLVHHLLLYTCPPYVNQTSDDECYNGDMSDDCVGMLAGWAVGGEVFEFPDNVGIPVKEAKFYKLEIHYNNIHKETGRTDSSGLRLHYTDKLRQHDAGVLFSGMAIFGFMPYEIPPKANHFHTYGVCNTTGFSEYVNPVPDLHVFAVLLHTHLAGRKVRVAQYRDGKQIDFIARNEQYDFYFQEIESLGNIKTIKHGDEIAVECTYSTTDRNNVTVMGLGTNDEMCLAFLFYYPAIDITRCLSHPNTLNLSMDAGNLKAKHGMTTDQDDIAAYENLLKTVPQYQFVRSETNYTVIENGIVREMMASPVTTCGTVSIRMCTSWIVNSGAIIPLLLWFILM